MDTRLLAGIIISLLVGTGVTYAATQNQQANLQNQISTYKTEADKIPALQQQINTLTNDKTNLQTQAATLQTQINSLTTDKTTLQQQFNDLNAQIATKNSQISNLNQ
jgi:chromosome segregation ATPase